MTQTASSSAYIYEKRLRQMQNHRLWKKLDLSFRTGYLGIIVLSLFAVLLNFSSPNWGLTAQMGSLLSIIVVIFVTVVLIPIILFAMKLTRSALLWRAFQHYDAAVYQGGYLSFEMLKEYLTKAPIAHPYWTDLVIFQTHSLTWKELHTSIRELPRLEQTKWFFLWIFSEESYPQPHLDPFKTLPSDQECWERLLGKESLVKAVILSQKDSLNEVLPEAISSPRKPSRL